MVCSVEVSGNVALIHGWRIYISQSIKGGSLAPFILRERHEFSERSGRRIESDTARKLAYRDAYAMVFFASRGEEVPTIGDKTVLHELIEAEFLHHDVENNTIALDRKVLATLQFGLEHQDEDGQSYRAVLEQR